MVVMLLASLDQTIVSTALPTIGSEFGGFEQIFWIVTAYGIAMTVAAPLYGKLGDLYGRKIVLQAAILIFVAGSIFCGLSQSMYQLTAARALQGLGGGGLMITTMAIIGDIVSPRERGRYQGISGGVMGVSTVMGPLIGGFFVEHLSWRWIFFLNIPLSLIALIVISVILVGPTIRRKHRLDFGGAGLLTVVLTSLVLLTSLGGRSYSWTSIEILSLAGIIIISGVSFIWVERRATEPILPLHLFGNRTFTAACLVGFIVGVAMFGAITYLPIYLQVVREMTPSAAGILLTPMIGGMLVSTVASGLIISKTGRYRIFPILGTAIMTLGLVFLAWLDHDTGAAQFAGSVLILGLGLGMVTQVLILSAQNSVDYRNLGVATAGVSFFRSAGGAIGVALFGALFAAQLSIGLLDQFPVDVARNLAKDSHAVRSLSPDLQSAYFAVFVEALHRVFLISAVVGALGFALSWRLKDEVLQGPPRAESLAEAFSTPTDATSLEELERILVSLEKRETSWEVFERRAERMGLTLKPDEIWILIQLCLRSKPVRQELLERRFAAPAAKIQMIVQNLLDIELISRDANSALLPTAEGRNIFDRVATDYRGRLTALLERWSPESHSEVRLMIDRRARALLAEMPMPS